MVVGGTAPTLRDVHSTPVGGEQLMAGAEVQANAIWTALDGLPLRSAAPVLNLLILIALAMLAPLARWRLPLGAVGAVTLLAGAAFLAAAELAFQSGTMEQIAKSGQPKQLFEILVAIDEAFAEQTRTRKRALKANLEFYKGVVYLALDIPKELFTACFAAARIFGWVAHVVEQRQDNRLIRPTALYVGPPPQPA